MLSSVIVTFAKVSLDGQVEAYRPMHENTKIPMSHTVSLVSVGLLLAHNVAAIS